MYTEDDLRLAEAAFRRAALVLALPVAVLLAGYVAAILAGSRACMLALALVCFAWMMFAGDLLLLPAKRYRRFLLEMQRGLRRSVRCRLQKLGAETEMQDGVRVHKLEALQKDGESRIFYISVNKAALLPPMGADVHLESYGRHIVNCSTEEA